MIKTLYKAFQHWSEKGSVYLYSDPHFSDDEMQYLRTNYVGDEEQIKRINSKVGKNDTLIILGDIGNYRMVARLNGYKVLIKGNHDAGDSVYEDYFDEVYGGPLFISDKILLSHEPIELPFALNIHGHDHSLWHSYPNCLNMCAEHIDYTPVSLKEIIKSGRLKHIDSIHRLTIDKRF